MNPRLVNITNEIKYFKKNFNPNNGFFEYRRFLKKLNEFDCPNYFWTFNPEQRTFAKNEKSNLKKFIWKKCYITYNNFAQKGDYSSALKIIDKLERELNIDDIDFPSETKNYYKKNKKEVKKSCEFSLKMKQINDQKRKNNYKDALEKLYDLLNSLDSNDNEKTKSINLEIKSTKTAYIKHVNQTNSELLYSQNYNNIDNIIKDLEKVREYRYEPYLNSLISETNKLYYVALNKKIEQKENLNENCDQEKEKIKSLKDVEKNLNSIGKYFKFEPKPRDIIKQINKEDTQNDDLNKCESESKTQTISIKTVDTYFEYLKIENKGNNDYNSQEKELREDIYHQIDLYNEELNILKNKIKDLNFKEWKSKNEEILLNNDSRGRVFALFNLINRQLQKLPEEKKYDIRPIQLISILILSKQNQRGAGKFLQINTGEGKSLIIQFFASYLAVQGKKVDIVTSSSVLADKDAKDTNKKNFYNKLGLTVGSASQNQYYCDIIYGDTQNFEAAILIEEFKGKEVRNGRPFNYIIVDEVDSISLDNIITMTQLTDSFPGRSCFYYFYYLILFFYLQKELEIKKRNETLENKTQEIKDYIMKQFKENILDEKGHLKEDLKKRIIYPNSMKNYIENSIETWIDNCIKATTMEEKKDFLKKGNEIIPIDYSNTGEIQSNMVWDGGLQQFLQIIHDAKGTYENENTNFLSNISFFKRYKGNIFGVTGTLGGESFRHILREVYKVNLMIIPPASPSQLERDKTPRIFKADEGQKHEEEILSNIDENIKREKSVLLICDTIKEGEKFYKKLLEKYSKEQVMKYFTEDDNSTIQKELQVKQIIVATNLAGRGTDIKISKKLEKNGGLHVIVSFFPLNQRIERQNYGRAGRNGQKGTYILIMKYNYEYGLLNKDELTYENLKAKRDNEELKDTKMMIDKEGKFIEQKEEIFNEFEVLLKENYSEEDNFVRANIEEQWGIILKSRDINEIRNNFEKLKKNDNKIIKNNLIKVQQICKYYSFRDESIYKIFEDEPKYSWNARIRYACVLAKDKIPKNHDLSDKYEAIRQFEKAIEIIDSDFMEDLSVLSVLNNTIFQFLEIKKKKKKDQSFKTKIQLQYEARKLFLESVKSLINENIKTIKKFINEYKKGDVIEKAKEDLNVQKIIEMTDKIKSGYKEDIQMYMDEFGFNRFEILVINKRSPLISNLIVCALGILEICVGTILIFTCKHPAGLKLAKFLIRDGIDNIVEGIKATVQGREIDLKEFGQRKAVKLFFFTMELAVGGGPIPQECDFKKVMFEEIKRKCEDELINYSSSKIVESLMCSINETFSKAIKDNIIGLQLKEHHDIYILNDIIKNEDKYRYFILEKTEIVLSQSEQIFKIFIPLIEFIQKLSESNNGIQKFKTFLDFIKTFDFKGLNNFTVNSIESIQNAKFKNEVKSDDLFTLSNILKNIDKNLTQEKVDEICKNLIEYGAIKNNSSFFSFSKKWELNKEYIEDKYIEFPKVLNLKVDDKYSKIKYDKKKTISYETIKYLNKIANRLSLQAINKKKQQIKDDVYAIFEKHLTENVKLILNYLMNKSCEKIEFLISKYSAQKTKKKSENKKDEIEKKLDENESDENNEEENFEEEEIENKIDEENKDSGYEDFSDEDNKEEEYEDKEEDNTEKEYEDKEYEDKEEEYEDKKDEDKEEDNMEKEYEDKEEEDNKEEEYEDKEEDNNSKKDKIISFIEEKIEKTIEKGKESNKQIEINTKKKKISITKGDKFHKKKYVKRIKVAKIAKTAGKLCGAVKTCVNVYNNVKDVYDSYKEDGNSFGENTQNVIKEKLIDTSCNMICSSIPVAGGFFSDYLAKTVKKIFGIKPKKKEEKKDKKEKKTEIKGEVEKRKSDGFI